MKIIKKYIKNNKFLYRNLKFIKEMIFNIIGYIFTYTTKINNNKIVVCNFLGKGYGCNPKYIIEEIISQNLKYDIVWMVDDIESKKYSFPREVRLVKYGTINALYELITAKVWIDNTRKEFYPPKKRDNQYYIQTWHAGIGLKLVEKDAQLKLSKNYIKNAKNDSKMADLFISNSKWCTNRYRNSFWYQGEILECGCPRVDILFKENTLLKKKILQNYNINTTNNNKIVLYAPTFRNSSDLECYNLDYYKCLDYLEKKFGGKWTMFIRLHPNISHLSENLVYSDKIINVSSYPDMQELLAISDILITDYSSSIFDFSYIKKPVFIYATDYENYIKERGVGLDIKNLPFKVNHNDLELFDTITNFNIEKYNIDIEEMLNTFGLVENGMASKKVVEKIKQYIK